MAVTFQIPPQIERGLRQRLGDLDQAAKEAALIELYRQAKLSHAELAEALAVGRLELDGILKRHKVTEDLMTVDELQAELRSLSRDSHSPGSSSPTPRP